MEVESIIKMFDMVADKHSKLIAIEDERNNSMTYENLKKQSAGLARCVLRKLNGEIRLPVIIYMERAIDMVLAIIAVLRADCYYIPIEKNCPIERLKYIISDSKASLIITDTRQIYNEEVEHVCINDIDCTYEGAITLPKSGKDELCYMIYTSGTSSYPKGVMIKHGNLCNLVEALYDIVYKNIPEYSGIAVVASFSFDASVKQIFCSLLFGHRLVICDKRTKYFGRKLHAFYIKYNIYLTDMTPTILNTFVVQHTKNKAQIEVYLVGGEILTKELVQRFYDFFEFKPILINLYGPTECCVDVSGYFVEYEKLGNIEGNIIPIGLPIKNTAFSLESKGNFIDDNEVGELIISGMCVGKGYTVDNSSFFLNCDGITSFRTGDLAKVGRDGNYYLIGRRDSQVKIHGNRVDLIEVESIFRKCIEIKDIHIMVIKEVMYAFIVTNEISLDIKKVSEKVRLFLPEYMIPKYYINIDSIRFNHNGKIDEKYFKQMICEDFERFNVFG